MISLSDFFPGIRLEALGCPEAILLKAVRDTVRDLCGTHIWTEDLYKISLHTGYQEYDMELPPEASLVSILSARFDGVPVPVYTSNDMDTKFSTGWRDETGPGISAVVSDTRDTVRVYPVPSADNADALLLSVSLKPSITATTCGDILADWSEVIEHGSLAKLKAMNNKPWTSKGDVAFHNGEYRRGRAEARDLVLRGHSDKSLTVEPREFGV